MEGPNNLFSPEDFSGIEGLNYMDTTVEEIGQKSCLMNTATLKPAALLKVTLLHGCFSRYLNCTNGAELRKPSHLIKLVDTSLGICGY